MEQTGEDQRVAGNGLAPQKFLEAFGRLGGESLRVHNGIDEP